MVPTDSLLRHATPMRLFELLADILKRKVCCEITESGI